MVAETQIALNKLDIADKEAFKYETAKIIINKITSKTFKGQQKKNNRN